MWKGKLIVFEGPDGVGKSTFASKLADLLRKQGDQVVNLSFPGNAEGTLGNLVYDIHHYPDKYELNQLNPSALQVLHIAAHIDCIESTIARNLNEGKIVILDRYWWSAWVYGITDGIQVNKMQAMVKLEQLYWQDNKPDIVFLFTSEKPFRAEQPTAKYKRLRVEYLKLLKESDLHIVEIENRDTINSGLQEILDHLRNVIPLKGTSSNTDQQTIFPSEEMDKRGEINHEILVRLSPVKPTEVYETYWKFACKRQEVFHARASGRSQPWTDDKIIQRYKFTNAYRASDRTSQYLCGVRPIRFI